MSLMDALTARRKEIGMSQSSLAKAVGVSRFSIIDYEKRRVSPTLDIVEKIAHILSVDHPNPPPPPTAPEDTGAERKTA